MFVHVGARNRLKRKNLITKFVFTTDKIKLMEIFKAYYGLGTYKSTHGFSQIQVWETYSEEY